MIRKSKTILGTKQSAFYNLIKGLKEVSNDDKKFELSHCLKKKLKKFLESRYFTTFIIIVIIINSICMGLETLYSSEEKTLVFVFLEHFFNVIYNLEFLLKLYVMKLSYFKNAWNWFDFFLLLIIYNDLIWQNFYPTNSLSSIYYISIKSLKAFRTLKAVSFVKGLQVILSALIKTLSNSVINVVIVTLLIMFIFSIIANSLFPREEWSSLKNSMWTLFRYICGDEWPEIQDKIDNFAGSRIFTIFFVFIGNFIFANIFIGLIIMNISEAQIVHHRQLEEEKARSLSEKKTNILKKQFDQLTKYFDQNTSDEPMGSNFSQIVKNYYESLSHSKDLIWPRKLCTNLTWLKSFLNSCKLLDEHLLIVKQMHVEMANCLAALAEERFAEEIAKKNND